MLHLFQTPNTMTGLPSSSLDIDEILPESEISKLSLAAFFLGQRPHAQGDKPGPSGDEANEGWPEPLRTRWATLQQGCQCQHRQFGANHGELRWVSRPQAGVLRRIRLRWRAGHSAGPRDQDTVMGPDCQRLAVWRPLAPRGGFSGRLDQAEAGI